MVGSPLLLPWVAITISFTLRYWFNSPVSSSIRRSCHSARADSYVNATIGTSGDFTLESRLCSGHSEKRHCVDPMEHFNGKYSAQAPSHRAWVLSGLTGWQLQALLPLLLWIQSLSITQSLLDISFAGLSISRRKLTVSLPSRGSQCNLPPCLSAVLWSYVWHTQTKITPSYLSQHLYLFLRSLRFRTQQKEFLEQIISFKQRPSDLGHMDFGVRQTWMWTLALLSRERYSVYILEPSWRCEIVNIFIDESMLSRCFKIINKIILFLWKRKMVSCIFKNNLIVWCGSCPPPWLKAITS